MKQLTLALICLVVCVTWSCTDSLYRHDVVGRVLDDAGEPIAGATVARTKTSGGSEVYGLRHLYELTTDRDGAFSFSHTGMGNEPAKSSRWFLRASADGFATKVQSVAVPWVDGNRPDQSGYILHGVTITLQPR